MSKRLPKLLLEDMLTAVSKIQAYTAGLDFSAFEGDEKTQDAVVRNFEIIGEAANKLPNEFLEQHPAVDWGAVIGFRNVLIHNYFGIDLSFVWGVVHVHLPKLKADLQSLAAAL